MWHTLGCAKCVALLWSNVVCDSCSGPWVLGRKAHCAHSMTRLKYFAAMTWVLSLVSHPCLSQCDDVGVVLGVSPMPEPVRCSLQGPWCLTGDLCWVARFRKVPCAQVMHFAMVLSLGSHWVHCDL